MKWPLLGEDRLLRNCAVILILILQGEGPWTGTGLPRAIFLLCLSVCCGFGWIVRRVCDD